MRVVLVCVTALTACSQTFGLDHVDPPLDATEGSVDADPCRDPAMRDSDEDADGVVDGCDVCPGVADADQTDSDADGVGDVCDPHFTEPIDRIAFFDGFGGSSMSPSWEAIGTGTWTQSGGALRQTDTSRTNIGLVYLRKTFENVSLEMTMTDQLPESPDTSAGMWLSLAPGQTMSYPTGLACHVYLSSTYGHLVVVEPTPLNNMPKADTTILDGARVRLRGSYDGTCSGVRDDLARVTARIQPPLPAVAGEIAVRASKTPIVIESVTVFETTVKP